MAGALPQAGFLFKLRLNMHRINIPLQAVSDIKKHFPTIFKELDIERQKLFKGWQDIYKTMICPYFMIEEFFNIRNSGKIEDNQLLVAIYMAYAWRATQDIVFFDKDIYNYFKYTDIDRNLPINLFYQFPAWSIWFDLPNMEIAGLFYDGFFASICTYINIDNEKYEFLVIYPYNYETHDVCKITINLEQSLSVAVDNINNASELKGMTEKLSINNSLMQAINMIIYVCAYGLNGGTVPVTTKPEFPMPRKTKKGWRIFPPDKPRIHVLGKEFGDMIRKAESTYTPGTGTSKRPHVRRAHWHSYWTGARQDADNRKLIVKWLHPMIIGGLDQCQNDN